MRNTLNFAEQCANSSLRCFAKVRVVRVKKTKCNIRLKCYNNFITLLPCPFLLFALFAIHTVNGVELAFFFVYFVVVLKTV